ncbi:hypothetical protein M3Y99_00938200 [Aphelenchoides fujianensis]|nr:hypothetical protein M3Y99_00938200 [Aphelenchoides fujianensis]
MIHLYCFDLLACTLNMNLRVFSVVTFGISLLQTAFLVLLFVGRNRRQQADNEVGDRLFSLLFLVAQPVYSTAISLATFLAFDGELAIFRPKNAPFLFKLRIFVHFLLYFFLSALLLSFLFRLPFEFSFLVGGNVLVNLVVLFSLTVGRVKYEREFGAAFDQSSRPLSDEEAPATPPLSFSSARRSEPHRVPTAPPAYEDLPPPYESP